MALRMLIPVSSTSSTWGPSSLHVWPGMLRVWVLGNGHGPKESASGPASRENRGSCCLPSHLSPKSLSHSPTLLLPSTCLSLGLGPVLSVGGSTRLLSSHHAHQPLSLLWAVLLGSGILQAALGHIVLFHSEDLEPVINRKNKGKQLLLNCPCFSE